ncbi:glycosyltransferase family 2 protein [Enterobacter hormaechei]|uniref:glycosyltransferase family 2 protein n=1 Tax=Enterobacter hormaechei TaxID=158836 RepID=UPI0007945C12|nr:glycosyltransferase family 2 protein [Enterobacter hormaechei]THA93234.1 glycosyltransferase family 2 protein [Enterobacter hormaechei]CZZ41881.1 glycosyl transferase family protein [Enterobacter hormaechei]SAA25389.1 glycosyl transferase family protein [Enterobacter hormaechei]SAA88659.1 glycosyl transferase family protein [Enterobacter hormaechei]SAG65469.1 glycosyl transferase family protein [Enterobacter hormaechei]
MNKVYSLITTYQPELSSLKALVKNLSKQTNYIVIANNSNFDISVEELEIESPVHIINFGKNLGIAEAQSRGMKWAFDNGADFILQMDQDSTPHEDMVQQLMQCYLEMCEQGYNPGLVGVQDYDKVTGEINKARVKKGTAINDSYYDVDSTLSSGSLIPRKAWETVGGMRDDLFIDAVDHEYCWRLRYAGFKIIRNKNALLAHRLGDGRFKILNLVSVGMPSPFRHYYATRNIFLLLKEKHVPLFWKLSSLIKLAGKIICYPIFLPKGKQRLGYFLKGIKDGLTARSGMLK